MRSRILRGFVPYISVGRCLSEDFLPAPLCFHFIQARFSSPNNLIVQDESQVEEEARSSPQAQEKKDEGAFQVKALASS
ncbi:hypothetical protein XA68_10772 [Ophiocordyceps unilateralis]|uniref:Uncharacterized protein n=1 Tax=Ophiocordyceps unilateralis TaxID=268505 RepID=A0A2A9PI57_OPHUN|nr:hypothetical protein XA68_10772 [Ophiocordyceps unilateralis]